MQGVPSRLMYAGNAGALTRKLDDGVVRLLMRMLLLYIQQAPVHRANHSVQQALALLPMLLGPSLDSLNRSASSSPNDCTVDTYVMH